MIFFVVLQFYLSSWLFIVKHQSYDIYWLQIALYFSVAKVTQGVKHKGDMCSCGLGVGSQTSFCGAVFFHFLQHLVEPLVHDVPLCPLDCRRATRTCYERWKANRPDRDTGRKRAPTHVVRLVAVPEMRVGRPGSQGVADVGVAGEGFPRERSTWRLD